MSADVLSIDPATRKKAAAMGWARFQNRELLCCGVLQAAEFLAALRPGGAPVPGGMLRSGAQLVVVVERPRWFPGRTDIDANDILDLSAMVGRVEAAYLLGGAEVELVPARDWKGTIRADISNRRVLEALSARERTLIPMRPRAKDHDHNIVDAVGLGLWKIGRF